MYIRTMAGTLFASLFLKLLCTATWRPPDVVLCYNYEAHNAPATNPTIPQGILSAIGGHLPHYPSLCKNSGGVGEMSEWILRFQPRTKPLIYFRQGVSRLSGSVKKEERKDRGKTERSVDTCRAPLIMGLVTVLTCLSKSWNQRPSSPVYTLDTCPDYTICRLIWRLNSSCWTNDRPNSASRLDVRRLSSSLPAVLGHDSVLHLFWFTRSVDRRSAVVCARSIAARGTLSMPDWHTTHDLLVSVCDPWRLGRASVVPSVRYQHWNSATLQRLCARMPITTCSVSASARALPRDTTTDGAGVLNGVVYIDASTA